MYETLIYTLLIVFFSNTKLNHFADIYNIAGIQSTSILADRCFWFVYSCITIATVIFYHNKIIIVLTIIMANKFFLFVYLIMHRKFLTSNIGLDNTIEKTINQQ